MLGLCWRFNPLQVTAWLEHLEGTVGTALLARPVARALGGVGGQRSHRDLCVIYRPQTMGFPSHAHLFFYFPGSLRALWVPRPLLSLQSPLRLSAPQKMSPTFGLVPGSSLLLQSLVPRRNPSWSPGLSPHGHRTGSTLDRAQVTHHSPSAPTDTVSSEKHHQPLTVYGHSALSPL